MACDVSRRRPEVVCVFELFVFPCCAELAECDGKDGRPLYVGCNGTVFDMASHPTGPGFYGPGAGYYCFVGRDATVMFARMLLDPNHPDCQNTVLSNQERDTMMDWVRSQGWCRAFLPSLLLV